MKPWRRAPLVVLTVLVCIGCDQATKAAAVEHLPRDRALSFAADTVRLQYVENRGAFLGLGDQLPEPLRFALLTLAVAVVLGAFLVWLVRAATLSAPALVACSLICGGGIGNCIDRALRSGYVVDFLNCGVGPVRTGIFNVADVAITGGALFLIAASLFARRAPD